MITKEEIGGNWKSVVGAVKEKFSQITGDELTGLEGNLDKLIGLIQRKSGQSREWVETFIRDASSTTKDMSQRVGEATSQYASQAAEVVRENYDHLSEAAQRGYDNTMKTVSNRPLESVAIALGCGLVTGLIVGLSMASRRR